MVPVYVFGRGKPKPKFLQQMKDTAPTSIDDDSEKDSRELANKTARLSQMVLSSREIKVLVLDLHVIQKKELSLNCRSRPLAFPTRYWKNSVSSIRRIEKN